MLLFLASLRRIVRWTCGKADFVKSLQGGLGSLKFWGATRTRPHASAYRDCDRNFLTAILFVERRNCEAYAGP